MFLNNRTNQVARTVSLLLIFCASYFSISNVFGQDGAPTQPEVQSFEPIGTNQMVDLFTGDFTYNIPLFNLPGPDGGYPINLAYHSGIQMEQEATWVGLGWNINVGTINRQTRNLPDDFGGSDDDQIVIKTDMKPNWTVGGKFGVGFELFGLDLENAVQFGLIPSLRLYYNNYKGVGYTLAFGFDMGIGNNKSALTGNLGWDLTLDSQDGIGNDVNVSLSQRLFENSKEEKWYGMGATVGTGFNSRTGANRNLLLGTSIKGGTIDKVILTDNNNNIVDERKTYNRENSAGAPMTLANPVASMNIPYEMKGVNTSFSYSFGLNIFGAYKKATVTADYSMSKLAYKYPVVYKGIGYLYQQEANNADQELFDNSREKEVLIHKDTRRLGTPTHSYDIYSATGQGIGHSFRPYRYDLTSAKNSTSQSNYQGVSGGIEIAPSPPTNLRSGLDFGANNSSTNILDWSDENTNAAGHNAQTMISSTTKSIYFQNYGENSSDDLETEYGTSVASENALAYGLENDKGFYNILNKDLDGNALNIETSRSTRKRRSVGIEAYTNEQLLDTDGQSLVISEFASSYFEGSVSSNDRANLTSIDNLRENRVSSHIGGYIATNVQGLRYVYGIAAYNGNEKDATFSLFEANFNGDESVVDIDVSSSEIDYKVPGTNEFYQSRVKTNSAHSYLLTAVLGSDYVDLDNIPGPSEGDLGYWVKFNYRRVDADMKWRSPFEGAAYDRGYEQSLADGTGRYSYGEKEVWYLATIESKTHVAEFTIKPRKDAKEPAGELNKLGDGTGTAGYYLLEKIDIYSKAERYLGGAFNSAAKPIKTCHFTYDYSLCEGIENNSNDPYTSPYESGNQGGKLTLKKFHFTYNGNEIGKTTPYEFEYNTTIGGQTINYDRNAIDRWGVYQPSSTVSNLDYPYNSPYTSISDMGDRAKLWSMSAINLPSGARFEIEYEPDSYGYVQDEVAMHMFKIKSLENYATISNALEHEKDAAAIHRRVYFELEQTISTSEPDISGIMNRYIRPGEYLYFKVAINVMQDTDINEMVGGYAKVSAVGVDVSSEQGGEYLWGYVELDFLKSDGKQTHYHPFTEVGARHIKFNHPDILYDNAVQNNAQMADNSNNLSKSDIKSVGNSLLANGKDIVDLFSDFTTTLTGLDNTKRLSHIDLSRSFIRLRTPDKIKYGGGHRVKQITITDNWADAFLTPGTESSSTYGTVYDYNLYDTSGNVTGSSGVSAYEPMVGGDEIPLRKPIAGWEDKNLASKNEAQTYTEEPGNESLFPGPMVGYSQVRVTSLNTVNKISGSAPNVASYGGVTISEFYTAKDYPVYQDVTELETDKSFRKSRLIVPALIVNIDRLRMAATQGYYIETNDMHGKPKGGREIGFTDQGEEIEISSVKYDYFDQAAVTWNDAGEKLITRRLDNSVDVIYSDLHPTDSTRSHIVETTLATDVEFIPETRYHESTSWSVGARMNFETFGIIPGLIPVPYFNWSRQRTGTVVTNKIMSKAGIQKKVTAVSRGSMVETEHLAFDQYTGQPLLTSVTNQFGDTVYGYSIQAYDVYESTGPAYKNIGMVATGTSVASTFADGVQQFNLTSNPGLFPGDELLATPVDASGVVDSNRDKEICHFVQRNASANYVFETDTELSGLYQFMVIRSGRRNLLGAAVSSITALKNPTENRSVSICQDYKEGNSLNVEVRSIDSVLSINAVELGDKWYKNTREIATLPSDWSNSAFYSKGMSGVHSSVRDYAYVADRIQTESGGETAVKLRTDGVMNDVPLFDWHYILAKGSGCPQNWTEVNHVTLKNPSSAAIETKNILGTYSSSLYGRSGTEPIATAGNAQNSEIGFESFEEYPTGSLAITNNATTNLNFYTNIDVNDREVEDRYDVYDGYNNIAYVKVDYALLNKYSDFTIRIHFDGYNDDGAERLVRVTPTLTNMGGGVTQIDIASIYANLDVPNYDKRRWRGEVFVTKVIPDYPTSTNTGVVVSDDIAHTGTKSVVVTSTTGSKFLQGRLSLQPGEQYQFSGWFSSPENIYLLKNYSDLFYTKMKLEFFDMDGVLVSSKEFEEEAILNGKFIEDWQKFTVDFTMPAGAYYVSINLPTSNQVVDTETQTTLRKAYYDDLRIQPLDGGMEAYVYNQQNQRLEATLDANNYATFYYYDDEGSLFLVKRETAEGVITVQESRSYLKRN